MRSAAVDILGAGGAVERSMSGAGPEQVFESRPQQLAMTAAVERALASGGRLMVEAGTGVGKSLAYLVPAILRCVTAGERVVVATHTIALQEQLVRKDVPLLAESLRDGSGWGLDPASTRPLKPVLVKGRGNYVSIRRLHLASQRQDRLFPDAAGRRSLHVIEDWAAETLDGTLSTLPPIERPGVWDRVQSDADNCMGRKCPHFEACFYQRARREMDEGNLLICNHALFFADLAMRATGLLGGAGFLPEYQHVILDEAHNAEEVACDHFGLSLTESRVEHFLGVLYHARTRKGYLAQLDGLLAGDREPAWRPALDGAIHATLTALDASRTFFDALLIAGRSRGGGGRDPGLLPSGRVARAGIVENTLTPALKALAGRLRILREQVKNEPDKFELNAYAVRADAIAFDADVLIDQSREASVYWLEAGGDPGQGEVERASGLSGRPRVRLACSPVEVGPILREHLWRREIAIVMCSATLALSGSARVERAGAQNSRNPDDPSDSPGVDDDEAIAKSGVEPAFAHIADQLGCDAAETLLLGSPFEYARQAEALVDLGVPDARSGGRAGEESYVEAVARRVAHHVIETEGGAFVLFTSNATLRAVADRLAPILEREGLPLLVQGRDGTAGRLVEMFRRDERTVLLGAASLWQGVDVRGRALRNVIIVKLPFDPPDRPIVEARAERLRAQGRSPFAHDALPRAILRFKQGFGRLIRSRDDHGRVVVLDRRLVSTSYGRLFLDALPPGVRLRRVGDEHRPDHADATDTHPRIIVPDRVVEPMDD